MFASGEYYGATSSHVELPLFVAGESSYECRTELHPNRVKEWADLIFAVTRIVVESRIKVQRKSGQHHGCVAVEKPEVWPRWQRPPPDDRPRLRALK